MAKVMVYRVKLYDAANDAPKISRRMATRRGAEVMCGHVLENTAIRIEDSQLENGEQWTAVDFNPNPSTGFQTKAPS
jgi:hypothetical protein